ncbi:GNAT family protein [Teredinibacter sp. KSP-S5-2]|uniref:GNAT family N-acetyltransferase n=1 Tax=Teredinibacter sp. KSP-S5-2 TaxID=3034506 RepID=UPI00293482A5|nr:GNAT family protein [Teredinibacter sp. KSP-S5-2]WNO08288.1 GNAT family protein [Teredinibacter sp. KSP-S5-2]
MKKQITEKISIEYIEEKHAQILFDLTDSNRVYLRKWLPWVDRVNTVEDTATFIAEAKNKQGKESAASFALFFNDSLCGVVGFHEINTITQTGMIGYWLAEAFTGKGIMTTAVKAVSIMGFKQYDLHKIIIRCADKNNKSRAIPERLGFLCEAVLQKRHQLYDQDIDVAVYSLQREKCAWLTE